jgi:hypothetical protein
MSDMPDHEEKREAARLDRNRKLHRDLFLRQGVARHAFVVQPTTKPIWEVGDFTTSDRPISDFVPGVVEDFQLWSKLSDAVGDDAVPFARLSTGTHIYAVCFDAKPHFYADNNPFAEPCVASADDAERIPEPPLENCRPLMRVLELAAAVGAFRQPGHALLRKCATSIRDFPPYP